MRVGPGVVINAKIGAGEVIGEAIICVNYVDRAEAEARTISYISRKSHIAKSHILEEGRKRPLRPRRRDILNNNTITIVSILLT